MNIDVLSFFQIFLAGFITVWTFRYFTNRTTRYSEFEWFALSAFWGLFVLVTIQSILNMKEQLTALYANPFATGFTMSLFGIIVGYFGSRIVRWNIFKKVVIFFGKGTKDESGDILNKEL